jgi:hypothetical protein
MTIVMLLVVFSMSFMINLSSAYIRVIGIIGVFAVVILIVRVVIGLVMGIVTGMMMEMIMGIVTGIVVAYPCGAYTQGTDLSFSHIGENRSDEHRCFNGKS